MGSGTCSVGPGVTEPTTDPEGRRTRETDGMRQRVQRPKRMRWGTGLDGIVDRLDKDRVYRRGDPTDGRESPRGGDARVVWTRGGRA